MPIVEAFKGTIRIEAHPKNSDETMYKHEIDCFGGTIGELLDRLVEASVVLADTAFEWVMMNMPTHDLKTDGHWFYSIAFPEVTRSENPADWEDIGGGSTIESFEDIVLHAAMSRDLHIASYANRLTFSAVTGPAHLYEPAVPFRGIYGVSSFREKTNFGWTGKELDSLLGNARGHAPENIPVAAGGKKNRSWWRGDR